MKISIISIGNELLNGKTTNTNASFIGKELGKIGLNVYRILTVADDQESLKSAFDLSNEDSDIVFCSGGLGPTNDDMTRKIVADYFDDGLVCFDAEIEKIKSIFKKFGRDSSKINEMQAYYPSKAILFENLYGTASAFLMHFEKSNFFFLPGVPYEMEHLTTEKIIPYIKKSITEISDFTFELFRIVNVPESILYEKLQEIIETNAELEFAFYPNFLFVDVYIRGAKAKIQKILPFVENILENLYYSRSEKINLIDVISELMINKGQQLSVAESCTGGLLAAKIVEKSGVSAFFRGGLVVYDNNMKMTELGVKKATLDQFGAVSDETVSEMALGALKRFRTEYSIAISGIAGPDGGSDEKPIGLVSFAIGTPNGVKVAQRQLGNVRKLVQQRAVNYAQYLLWQELKNN